MQFPPRNIFSIPYTTNFYQKALQFAATFGVFCLTDGNNPLFENYPQKPFQTILAVGIAKCEEKEAKFSNLDEIANLKEWLFGYMGYDVKNQLEDLVSLNEDKLQFPELYFFVPQHLFFFTEQNITIQSFDTDIEAIIESIENQDNAIASTTLTNHNLGEIKCNFTKEEYVDCIEKIKQHIIEGDVYELNFCMNFYLENVTLNPITAFLALKNTSPMPFASLFKLHEKYVLCASPERFLKKEGTKIISQPIKGTMKRGKNQAEDEILKYQLRHSEKEIAENMMIVDLVRNDLARTAKTGTVKVEEIFGIYTFPQVHQMISTVTAQIDENTSIVEVIKNAFPMGSMTGAPKIKAMELIEQYEKTKRNVFSGAIGYMTPNQDFDFNVVIRSIFYDNSQKYLSFQAGSAITYDSIATQEYEECLLKTKAIREVLEKTT